MPQIAVDQLYKLAAHDNMAVCEH